MPHKSKCTSVTPCARHVAGGGAQGWEGKAQAGHDPPRAGAFVCSVSHSPFGPVSLGARWHAYGTFHIACGKTQWFTVHHYTQHTDATSQFAQRTVSSSGGEEGEKGSSSSNSSSSSSGEEGVDSSVWRTCLRWNDDQECSWLCLQLIHSDEPLAQVYFPLACGSAHAMSAALATGQQSVLGPGTRVAHAHEPERGSSVTAVAFTPRPQQATTPMARAATPPGVQFDVQKVRVYECGMR